MKILPLGDVQPDVDKPNRFGNDELRAYANEHRFDYAVKPKEDTGIFYYQNTCIGSRGNIVAINGKSKSRKTVVCSAIATSCFIEDNFLGFHAKLNPEDSILHIDTEQAYQHYYKSTSRIFLDAGLKEPPKNFHSFFTRDADIPFRIALLEYLMETMHPTVLILDGITDFIFDINNQAETVELGTKLLQWSTRYNMLIITVIHTTEGNGKMTGAIGTWLKKKCETSIRVEKDEDKGDTTSRVMCDEARDKPFAAFDISYNESLGRYESYQVQKTGSGKPQDYTPQQHLSLLKQVFGPNRSISGQQFGILLSAKANLNFNYSFRPADLARWKKYYLEMTMCHEYGGLWEIIEKSDVWNDLPAPAATSAPPPDTMIIDFHDAPSMLEEELSQEHVEYLESISDEDEERFNNTTDLPF
jgi:hypothetical protein